MTLFLLRHVISGDLCVCSLNCSESQIEPTELSEVLSVNGFLHKVRTRNRQFQFVGLNAIQKKKKRWTRTVALSSCCVDSRHSDSLEAALRLNLERLVS